MRLPVNLMLYIAATGLFGLAGYTFYQGLQIGRREMRTKAHDDGMKESTDLLAKPKSKGPAIDAGPSYATGAWKSVFCAPNLTGKLPVVDRPVDPTVADGPPKHVDLRPIDQIIELVSLVSDTSTDGKGGQSHVVVRYKDGADVQPPSWYLLANTPPPPSTSSSTPMAAADTVPGRGRPMRPQQPFRPANTPAPTPMPASSAGAEYLQRVWVTGDGTPRYEATLWPPFQDIRLVQVATDALTATFERDGAPTADGKAGPRVEEVVVKSSLDLSSDVKLTLVEMHRLEASRVKLIGSSPSVAIAATGWQDVEETRMVDNTVQISRKDQNAFQANPETFLDRVNIEPYVSSTGSGRRGLRIANVATDIATRYGVQQNDIILAINDEPVSTKADAIAVGKRLYNRGVRTFVVRFLSNGQQVDRTYQAPDR